MSQSSLNETGQSNIAGRCQHGFVKSCELNFEADTLFRHKTRNTVKTCIKEQVD